MNRPRLTGNRGLADTVFAWACAIATIGFLTTAVVIGANGGGWRITETLIWAVLIGWLLLLTGKTRGQDDRIDGAVDVADRALGAAQHDGAVAHGRHAARPTPRPRDQRLKESA